MEELRKKLDSQISMVAKKKMISKDYDEMEGIDSILGLNIPNLDVSLIRELIEASYSLQKQMLANKKIVDATSGYVEEKYKVHLKKAKTDLDEANDYYNSLLDSAVNSLDSKKK